MTLQEKIRADLKVSMKARDEARTSALRVLIGEFGRQGKKELDDRDVVAIITKLIKSERETLDRSGQKSSPYLEVLAAYQPKKVDEVEIRAWIGDNIDFAKFNNKMQAMRPIMEHFGTAADGNTVKKILEGM